MDNISTERLILREINESDANDIVRWRSDENVFKFFKKPHRITLEEHMHWFHSVYLLDDKRFDLMCIEKMTGNSVGVFGFIKGKSNIEVNYILSPEAQHKGYASEALGGLIQYIMSKYSDYNIIAEIHKDNEPSIRLIQKLGFALESRNDQFCVYSKNAGGI